MSDTASTSEPTETIRVRAATVADIDALIALRTVMFQVDGAEPGSESDSWQGACRQILLDGFAAADLLGAVAETDGGDIVATGIATLRRWLPSPTNPSGLTGYIGSTTTLEGWHRQGIGRRITQALITSLRERGGVDIELHANEAGERVYRSLGFTEHDGGTELRLHTSNV